MKLRALPVRCRLHRDESLASLLARLQLANCYEPSDWAWICRTYSGVNDSWWQPYKASSWHLLSTLTGIAAQRLYGATCHAYAPALQLPWHESVSTQVARRARPALAQRTRRVYQRKQRAARYCPHCLATAPYERLSWQITVTLACAKHRCLLLDACWQCRTALKVRELIVGRCNDCGADLTLAQPALVSVKYLQLQSRLTRWLRDPALPLPLDWPQQPVPLLFELLRGLVATLPYCANETGSLQLVQKRLRAANLLNCWPHKLHAYLDRCTPNKSAAVAADFGSLYNPWLENYWRKRAFEFLQMVFDDYLVTAYPASFHLTQLGRYQRRAVLRERLPYVSYSTTATMLGISRELLGFAVNARLIARYEGLPIIGRDEVQRVQHLWQPGISLAAACLMLGLDLQAGSALRNLFSLNATETMIPLASFDSLAVALMAMQGASPALNGFCSLRSCVLEQGISLERILRAILQGAVLPYWMGSDLWSAYLRTEEVSRLIETK